MKDRWGTLTILSGESMKKRPLGGRRRKWKDYDRNHWGAFVNVE